MSYNLDEYMKKYGIKRNNSDAGVSNSTSSSKSDSGYDIDSYLKQYGTADSINLYNSLKSEVKDLDLYNGPKSATGTKEKSKGIPILSDALSGAIGGLAGLGTMANRIEEGWQKLIGKEEEYKNYNAAARAGEQKLYDTSSKLSTIKEDDSMLSKIVKSSASSAGNLAVSGLVSTATGIPFLGLGATSTGRGIKAGEDREAKSPLLYGLTQGGIETLSELVIPGSKAMKSLAGGVGWKEALKAAGEEIGEEGLKALLNTIGKEATQEGLTEIAQGLAGNLFKDGEGYGLGADTVGELLENAIIGAGSGALTGGLGDVYGAARQGNLNSLLSTNKEGKTEDTSKINEAIKGKETVNTNQNAEVMSILAGLNEKVDEVGNSNYETSNGNNVNPAIVEALKSHMNETLGIDITESINLNTEINKANEEVINKDELVEFNVNRPEVFTDENGNKYQYDNTLLTEKGLDINPNAPLQLGNDGQNLYQYDSNLVDMAKNTPKQTVKSQFKDKVNEDNLAELNQKNAKENEIIQNEAKESEQKAEIIAENTANNAENVVVEDKRPTISKEKAKESEIKQTEAKVTQNKAKENENIKTNNKLAEDMNLFVSPKEFTRTEVQSVKTKTKSIEYVNEEGKIKNSFFTSNNEYAEYENSRTAKINEVAKRSIEVEKRLNEAESALESMSYEEMFDRKTGKPTKKAQELRKTIDESKKELKSLETEIINFDSKVRESLSEKKKTENKKAPIENKPEKNKTYNKLEEYYPDSQFETVTKLNAEQKSAVEIAKAFDKEVIFFKATGNAPQGFMVDGKIYLNASESGSVVLKTIGHEVFHSLKTNNTEAFNELVKWGVDNFTTTEINKFLSEVTNEALVEEYLNNPSLLAEEMIAESLGNDFANKDFWSRLEKSNKTLFEKIKDIINKVLSKIEESTNNFLTKKHVNELRTEFVNIFGEFTEDTTLQKNTEEFIEEGNIKVKQKNEAIKKKEEEAKAKADKKAKEKAKNNTYSGPSILKTTNPGDVEFIAKRFKALSKEKEFKFLADYSKKLSAVSDEVKAELNQIKEDKKGVELLEKRKIEKERISALEEKHGISALVDEAYAKIVDAIPQAKTMDKALDSVIKASTGGKSIKNEFSKAMKDIANSYGYTVKNISEISPSNKLVDVGGTKNTFYNYTAKIYDGDKIVATVNTLLSPSMKHISINDVMYSSNMNDTNIDKNERIFKLNMAMKEVNNTSKLLNPKKGNDIRFRDTKAKKTETESFKNWFKDSKIVDEHGKPLKLYHGTPDKTFNEFHTFFNGPFFTSSKDYAQMYAEKKGTKGRIIPVYLSIQKPLDTSTPEGMKYYQEKFIPFVKERYTDAGLENELYRFEKFNEDGMLNFIGADELWRFLKTEQELGRGIFDGLIVDEGDFYLEEGKTSNPAYIPLNANQIKSATKNNGEFNPNNNDIRFRDIQKNKMQVETRTTEDIPKVVKENLNSFINKVLDVGGKVMRVTYDDNGAMSINFKTKDGEFKQITKENGLSPDNTAYYGFNKDNIHRYQYVLRDEEAVNKFLTNRIENKAESEKLFNSLKEWKSEYIKENAAPILKPIKTGQIGSKEFNKWFGDSQVVDENGDPLVVYHGSMVKNISIFDSSKSSRQLYGEGFYFTEDINLAETYAVNNLFNTAGEIYKTYLKIEKPFILNSEEVDSYLAEIGIDESEFKINKMKELGYDGIYVEDLKYWIAFEPNQIKSATDNNGEFSPNNDDIRFRDIAKTESEKKVLSSNVAKDSFKASIRSLDGVQLAKAINNTVETEIEFKGDLKRVINDNVIDVAFNNEFTKEARISALNKHMMDKFNLKLNDAIVVSDFLVNLAEDSTKITNKHYGIPNTIGYSEKATETNAKSILNDLKAKMIDNLDAIKVVGKDVYNKALTSRLNYGKVGAILDGDRLYSSTGEVISKDGWSKITEEVFKDGSSAEQIAFKNYLNFKTSLARLENKGIESLAKDNGEFYSVEELKDSIADFENKYPKFSEKSERVYNFLDTFNREYLVKSGLISESQYESMRKTDPYWVPQQRDIEEGGYGYGNGKGFVNIKAPIHKAKGSKKAVRDPYGNIAEHIEKTVTRALKNEVGQHMVVSLLENPLLSEYAEVITNKNKVDSGAENVVSVLINGQKVYVKVNNEPLLKSLKALDEMKLHDALKPIEKAVRYFKKLTTSDNPLFAITNTSRDHFTYLANSDTNILRAEQFVLKAANEIKNNGEFKQLYEALGISGSNYTADTFVSKVQRLQNQKHVYEDGKLVRVEEHHPLIKTAHKVLGAIESVNGTSETVHRLAKFMMSIEDGKSIEEATIDAMEITTNFSRRGDFTKGATLLSPYLNASMQGNYRRFNQLFTSKERTAQTLLNIGITTAVMYALQYGVGYDEEERNAIPEYHRYSNYLIPLGDGKFIKIPKSREYGILFDSIFEMISDKGLIDGLATAVTSDYQNSAPDLKNFFLKPLVDTLGDNENATDWAGRDIIPYDLKELPSSRQISDDTSMFSRVIGQLTSLAGISPVELDYLIDQYTGIIGDIFLASDRALTQGDITKLTGLVTNKFYIEGDSYSPEKSKYYANMDTLTELITIAEQDGDDDLVEELKDIKSDFTAANKKAKEKYQKANGKELSELTYERVNNKYSDVIKEYNNNRKRFSKNLFLRV